MTTLLESKARPYGSSKGAALSVVLHGALIAGAIIGTSRVVLPERETIEEHPVLYVATPPPKVYVAPEPLPEVKRPPAAKAPAAPRQVAPPPRRQPQPRPQPQRTMPATPAIVAPITVPTSLPDIDLKAVPINDVVALPPPAIPPAPASSRGSTVKSSDGDVASGSASKGGLGSGNSGRAYSENQVDRAVVITRAIVPRYPDALKSVSVQGEVVVRYIVDTRGRVEPGSIQVLSSAHQLFSDAVRRALLDMRFRPAEAGGQSVRQLVEQPFRFKLQ